VQIRVPQRGDKRDLHETVTRNAREEFMRHRLRRAGDHNARSRAITDLQDQLGLPEAPLRIECYDMAHLQGTDYVGSMVVLEDGLPNKREYRRFRVKDVPGNDDYAAMEEVLTRRLTAYPSSGTDRRSSTAIGQAVASPTRRSCSSPTAARGQLGVAERVVRDLGLEGEIPVAGGQAVRGGGSTSRAVRRRSRSRGGARRVHAAADPRRPPLRQHVPRRAAVERMTTSALDGIVGPARPCKKARKRSLAANAQAGGAVRLQELTWLPDPVAAAVHAKFHPGDGP
jgi:excinuclease ABC subunit C